MLWIGDGRAKMPLNRTIYLVPLGSVDESVIEAIRELLTDRFGFLARRSSKIYPGSGAYDGRRGQFVSSVLLSRLGRIEFPEACRVLGFIDADCYAGDLNFIFGQASAGGRDALIALARLHEEFYGRPPDRVLFEQRAAKEAIHELGHTYGLSHCSKPLCVMQFSNRLEDTDRKTPDFCDLCRRDFDSFRNRSAA